jgi:AcrR family transcriptional regulator
MNPKGRATQRPKSPGKRELKVTQTRQRIVAAVRQLLNKGGLDRLNVADLIRVAGVARSTVHYQFSTRQGLLDAVFRDAVASADVDWLRPARELDYASQAVEAMVVQACRAWAADQLLFRRLMALAAVDLEAHRAARSLEAEREQGIDELVKRLGEAQQLSLACPSKRTRSVLSIATNFWTFDRLLEETCRGWRQRGSWSSSDVPS